VKTVVGMVNGTRTIVEDRGLDAKSVHWVVVRCTCGFEKEVRFQNFKHQQGVCRECMGRKENITLEDIQNLAILLFKDMNQWSRENRDLFLEIIDTKHHQINFMMLLRLSFSMFPLLEKVSHESYVADKREQRESYNGIQKD
jgi:hypothetical protein